MTVRLHHRGRFHAGCCLAVPRPRHRGPGAHRPARDRAVVLRAGRLPGLRGRTDAAERRRGRAIDAWTRPGRPEPGGDAGPVVGTASRWPRAGLGQRRSGLQADAPVHLPLGGAARRPRPQRHRRLVLGRPPRHHRDRRSRCTGRPRSLARQILLRNLDPPSGMRWRLLSTCRQVW